MLDEVINTLDELDAKAKKRRVKVPKPVTLESELTRLAALKWKEDTEIFDTVRAALLSGEIKRTGEGKMKKDDIYALYAVLKEQIKEKQRQQVRESKPDNYYIVQDLRTWNFLIGKLFQEHEAGWDTETTGLGLFTDRIIGISAYLPKADIAFYAPYGHLTSEKQLSKATILGPLKEWLEDPQNRSVWHNFKYDGHMFANEGITVANPYWDTMVAARLLYEHETNHRLKPLYDKYCSHTEDKSALFEELFDEGDIAHTDVLLAGVYAAGDPYKTYKLYEFQKPHIYSVGNLKTCWELIEQPLLPVDLRVERQGLRVNLGRLKEIEDEQAPNLLKAEDELREAFHIDSDFLKRMSASLGREVEDFNFSSNDHLAYLLYDVLRVGEDMPKKFGKGARSTSGDVINAIIEDVPELVSLKKYRELSKLINTYAHKIPEALEVDGRLHSSFNSFGTKTGRYASSEYGPKNNKKGTNLQNVPARTELGKEIRKCIIPDDGDLFISSDLS